MSRQPEHVDIDLPYRVTQTDLVPIMGMLREMLEALRALRIGAAAFFNAANMNVPFSMERDIERQLDQVKKMFDSLTIDPVEEWLLEHRPVLDLLDGLYDCESPVCPAVGYHSRQSADMHNRIWTRFDKLAISHEPRT